MESSESKDLPLLPLRRNLDRPQRWLQAGQLDSDLDPASSRNVGGHQWGGAEKWAPIHAHLGPGRLRDDAQGPGGRELETNLLRATGDAPRHALLDGGTTLTARLDDVLDVGKELELQRRLALDAASIQAKARPRRLGDEAVPVRGGGRRRARGAPAETERQAR